MLAETRGDWPRMSQRSGDKDKATFLSPTNEWCLPAEMHVLTKDLNFSEFKDDGCYSHTVKCKQQKRRPCMLKKLDSENSAKVTDTPTSGRVARNPNLSKMGQSAARKVYVPFVVPGLSTSLSSTATPTSSTSVSQEAVVLTLHPA